MSNIKKVFKYIRNHKKQVAIGLSSVLLLLLLILYGIKLSNKAPSLSEEERLALMNNPEKLMQAGIEMDLLATAEEIAKYEEICSNFEDTQCNDESYEEDIEACDADIQNEAEENDETDDGLEYSNLAIAKVDKYVNVRSEANTHSEIVGKMYDGAAAEILETVEETDGTWFKVISGEVQGYIKAEYFIYGDEAAKNIDQYIVEYAVVNCDRLNIRKEPSTDSERLGYALYNEKLKLIEKGDEWTKVLYTDEKSGYVATEYIKVEESFIYAKTIEEEKAAEEEVVERQERETEDAEETPEVTEVTVVEPPVTSYNTNSELRSLIVAYALQYVGSKYVHAGQSLATGTDCSGFTMLILKEFGISVSRTPQGQYQSAGRPITEAELQPGDIVCYSTNGKSCTHVAFYIGNGQIVHAANSRKGVIISSLHYSTIIGFRNVID